MTTLENIPRLQACVKEGIRWAGAAAAMLPRIVPPGGIELHDTFIPEGVSILVLRFSKVDMLIKSFADCSHLFTHLVPT